MTTRAAMAIFCRPLAINLQLATLSPQNRLHVFHRLELAVRAHSASLSRSKMII